MILLLIPIRYNLKHANMEFKTKYVKPYYKRGYIIVFLVFCFLVIGLFVLGAMSIIFDTLLTGRYDSLFSTLNGLLMNILSTSSLSWILYREFVYLKRISKTQNVVNQ